MSIADKMKDLIIERNTNVNRIAKSTEIAPSTIYSILKRDSLNSSVTDLYKIAHYLGVTLDYFLEDINLDDDTQSYALNAVEAKIINRYRASDEDGKTMIETVVELEYRRAEKTKK